MFLCVIELITFIVCVVLAYKSITIPSGNYGAWLSAALLIFIGLEIFRRDEVHFIKREGIKLTPSELVKHNEKYRKIFSEHISDYRSKNYRKDVIIRHVNRSDEYPNTADKGKGISSWFRAGLVDTYHNGILVALQFYELIETPEGYRFRDYKKEEKGDIGVYLIGKIPYEFIEEVNFDGDEYYNYTHIFCHYKNKGQPYEELVFCEEVKMDYGHVFYKEIAKYEHVKKVSTSYGVPLH